MNNDLYSRLVDLYAGRELPDDVEREMEREAAKDPALYADMTSLRDTVDHVRSIPGPDFTEESYQRILMKLYARGAEFQPKAPAPTHLQYQLPIQG